MVAPRAMTTAAPLLPQRSVASEETMAALAIRHAEGGMISHGRQHLSSRTRRARRRGA